MASQPKTPNPYDTAAAQQKAELGASMGSSIINNPNEQNPYGSVNYGLSGYETIYDAKGKPQYVPRYNRTTTLSPDQMKLLGLETQTKGNAGQAAVTASSQLANMFKTQLDASKWQPWQMAAAPGNVQTSFGDAGAIRQDQAPTDRKAVEEAMLSRYRETAGRQATAEDAQLAARGLNPGSQGYGGVADTRARALTDAQTQAFLGSGQESRAAQEAYNQAQQQRYQQALQRAGFGNAAELQKYQMGADYAGFANQLRQAQQQSDTALRNQLPNEIAALMGMGQVTVPQFAPFSRQGINAAPVGDYINQAYQNQVSAANATNQGIFGLGGSLVSMLPFSDRRLKEDIAPTGERLAGVPLYTFHYRSDPGVDQIGVMADEAREIHPDAVYERGDFDTVDYGLLISRHEGELPYGF